MTKALSILLLAGSSEARQIAADLVAQGHAVRAIKSEPPRGPDPMPVPFEVIDAPDMQTIRRALAGVDAVVDASHGFDAEMTAMGHVAATDAGVPFVSLDRPAWDVTKQPDWRSVADVAAAMPLIKPEARVFSACGWASLPQCAGFPGAVLMLRQTTRHSRPPPFDFVELVFGDPPFSVEAEAALFNARAVDVLICRNLGGRASRPKLDAARKLGLEVILIARPPKPAGVAVRRSAEGILDWVAAL